MGNVTDSGKNKSKLSDRRKEMIATKRQLYENYINQHKFKVNPPLTKITLQALSQANNDQKAWICVQGKVYDITEYLGFHPGGKRVLMACLGRDCTNDFMLFHGKRQLSELQRYQIGWL